MISATKIRGLGSGLPVRTATRSSDLQAPRQIPSTRPGSPEIYAINTKRPQAGDAANENNTSLRPEREAWSPDATKIAFVARRDGNSEIYTMNTDGTGQTRLRRHPYPDRFLFRSRSPRRAAIRISKGPTQVPRSR